MMDEMMNLRGLLEKSPDADLLREMIGFAAQRLMELGVGGLTGAGFGEKNPERLAQRNGYRERDWETLSRHGRAAHPQAEEGQRLPGLPRAAIDEALRRRLPGLARAIGLARWGGFRRGTVCAFPTQHGWSALTSTGKRSGGCYGLPNNERCFATSQRTRGSRS